MQQTSPGYTFEIQQRGYRNVMMGDRVSMNLKIGDK